MKKGGVNEEEEEGCERWSVGGREWSGERI